MPPPYHLRDNSDRGDKLAESASRICRGRYCGFYLWELSDVRLTFPPFWLDSRFYAFPPEHWGNIKKSGHAYPEWETLLQRREGQFADAIAPVGNRNWLRTLATSSSWCEQYRDQDAVIFSRCEPIPMNRFHGRLALQQRVLPNYRAPFFDLLASACERGMSLFTGLPRPSEGITTAQTLQMANYHLGKNIHLLQWKLLSLLSAGTHRLAYDLESRCIDRRSKPALSFDAGCRDVDA